MPTRKRGFLSLGIVTFLVFSSWGAESEARWRVLNRAAREAIDRKDYPALRATLDELWPLMPGNARILYNMAASDAAVGRRERAFQELGQLADAGLVYDLSADEDFRTLRDTPQYQAIAQQMERNSRTVARAMPAQTISERDLLPEDLAYDAKQRAFFLASVTGAKIVRDNGEVWAQTKWPVMALRIDPRRRILWAATAWLPHCAKCAVQAKDQTALLSFDVDSGKLLKQFNPPVAGMLGDMTIGHKGELYVSEGIHGAVLRFAQGKFERLDQDGEFPSPQTPSLSADERTLYVPDYVRGIAAMDLQNRKIRWLKPAAGIVTSGIDGLYVYGDSFVAVQNGTKPPRVIRFSLDLKKQEILEANTEGLGEPTHGTLVGDTFYFLANGGWNEYGGDGKKTAGSAPVVSAIWKIALAKR